MEAEALQEDVKVFGFWIYLMTDLVIFGVLFAVYAVLHNNTFSGPTAKQLFHMPAAFVETLFLLTSSFTCSLATLALHRKQRGAVIFWFILTFLLGSAFLTIEIREFSQLIQAQASWKISGFLSSFFALVGTHGFHISVGLLWMIVAILKIGLRGLSSHDISRIFRLALFWHFLDVVWIFIFTFVYAFGHLA